MGISISSDAGGTSPGPPPLSFPRIEKPRNAAFIRVARLHVLVKPCLLPSIKAYVPLKAVMLSVLAKHLGSVAVISGIAERYHQRFAVLSNQRERERKVSPFIPLNNFVR